MILLGSIVAVLDIAVVVPSHAYDALLGHVYDLQSDARNDGVPVGKIAVRSDHSKEIPRGVEFGQVAHFVARSGSMLVRQLGQAPPLVVRLRFGVIPRRQMGNEGRSEVPLTLACQLFSTP